MPALKRSAVPSVPCLTVVDHYRTHAKGGGRVGAGLSALERVAIVVKRVSSSRFIRSVPDQSQSRPRPEGTRHGELGLACGKKRSLRTGSSGPGTGERGDRPCRGATVSPGAGAFGDGEAGRGRHHPLRSDQHPLCHRHAEHAGLLPTQRAGALSADDGGAVDPFRIHRLPAFGRRLRNGGRGAAPRPRRAMSRPGRRSQSGRNVGRPRWRI